MCLSSEIKPRTLFFILEWVKNVIKLMRSVRKWMRKHLRKRDFADVTLVFYVGGGEW